MIWLSIRRRDYEAFSCLTQGYNTISGRVFYDDNANGIFDGSDAGTGNVTVFLYRDVTNNDAVDAADILLSTQETASDGSYSFQVGSTGDFVLSIDTGDLPTTAVLTTDAVEEASFTDFGNTDSGIQIRVTISDIVFRVLHRLICN